MDNTKDTIYILDSYGLIYRAYYALFSHPLVNKDNQNISAVVIFFKNLLALISKYKPKYLAAAFDSRTPTFRHQRYPQYKANRAKTPEDLHAQVPWIEDILSSFGIPILQKDGFEADDVIATVSKKCLQENKQIRILSGDKDLMQLVDSHCQIMKPDKANGGWIVSGVEEVTQEWGVPPGSLLDLLSLTGDAADNVPGVKGVGDKTAVKLIKEYGTLENIYQHDLEIKGALGEKIRNDKENAFFSKELITLKDDVPVEINFEDFKTDNLNYAAVVEKLKFYGAEKDAKDYAKMGGISIDADSTQSSENSNTKNQSKPHQIFNRPEIINIAPENVKQNTGNYRPITNETELQDFVTQILQSPQKICAFDTETTGLDTQTARLAGFSLSYQEGSAVYVPVILPGEMFAPKTISKSTCFEELKRILCNPEMTVVLHNAKFDLKVLHSNGFNQEITCRIFDTMIAAWLLEPDLREKGSYTLEGLGEHKLGLKGVEFDSIVKEGQTFADLPLETAFPYGAEDSDFTLKLYNFYNPLLKSSNLEDIFWNIEMPVLKVITSMEEEGIHIDRHSFEEYKIELDSKISELEHQIYQTVGHEFKIASPKQLSDILFIERQLPTQGIKKTQSSYSTNEETLELLASYDPLVPLILEYRGLTKLRSTYVEPIPEKADKNDIVHTSFMQTGTATGRLSSRDPNLQNIPVRDQEGRRIRSAFTAPEGYVFISADYAQIELVVLSHLSGDKNMSEAFKNGQDIHKSTAALIYGVKPEEVTPQMRRTAKAINFGLMYGKGAFSLAKDLEISRTQASQFIESYFANYAQIKKYRDQTIADAKETGYVETFMGRRRYIQGITSNNGRIVQSAEREALNTPVQGSAADIVKLAMISTFNALKETNSPAKMILQVHDELIFQCPDDPNIIEETIKLITDKMENTVKLNVPLKVSVEYGHSWGEFH